MRENRNSYDVENSKVFYHIICGIYEVHEKDKQKNMTILIDCR